MNTAQSQPPASTPGWTSVTAYENVPGCLHPLAALRA